MKANLQNDAFYLSLVEEGKLKVTRSGKAYSLKTGKQLGKQRIGYRKLSWMCDKTKKIVQIQLHRLVWLVYNGPIADDKIQINHKDGIKSNCKLSNLELTTNKGNAKHAIKNGLVYIPVGDDKPNAIWTDSEVIKYRRLFAKGKLRIVDVAKKHTCTISTASGMLRKLTYKHLP